MLFRKNIPKTGEVQYLQDHLDSPEATLIHKEMIKSKYFLRKIYEEHYHFFKENIRNLPQGKIIELGSGGGFIKEIIPEVLTSDTINLPELDYVFSANKFPFESESLSAILMLNVFHHIQSPVDFFKEADRCLISKGRIIMIEPSCTFFSKLVFGNFHHEPMNPKQEDWLLPDGGRMSMANSALPWIVFDRDRARFEREFQKLKILLFRNFLPFRYILSGGLSRKQMVPSWMYYLIKLFEEKIFPFNLFFGMFFENHYYKR